MNRGSWTAEIFTDDVLLMPLFKFLVFVVTNTKNSNTINTQVLICSHTTNMIFVPFLYMYGINPSCASPTRICTVIFVHVFKRTKNNVRKRTKNRTWLKIFKTSI